MIVCLSGRGGTYVVQVKDRLEADAAEKGEVTPKTLTENWMLPKQQEKELFPIMAGDHEKGLRVSETIHFLEDLGVQPLK